MSSNNLNRFQLSDFFDQESIHCNGHFNLLDEVDTTIYGALVFCQNINYLNKTIENSNITSLICKKELENYLPDSIGVVFDEDPRSLFFKIYNKVRDLKKNDHKVDFVIGKLNAIHKSVSISNNVVIGDRVSIGANCVIKENTIIGDDVEICENVVIGAEGLITIREADGGLITIKHAGGVEIKRGCQILSGAVIAKSLFQRYTHIGANTQIGIMANIGHGAFIGDNCVVSGNSVVAGRVVIGKNVWIGTSSSISQGLMIGEGAQIKMGSVVVSNISKNETVSGNFAINHRINCSRFLLAKNENSNNKR